MSEKDVPAGPPPVMRVVRTRESLDDAFASLALPSVRSARAARAAVFTMGALHEGHLALVKACRERADISVIASYVNPLLFDSDDAFLAHPRALAADQQHLESLKADVLFAPVDEEMFPTGTLDRLQISADDQLARKRLGHIFGQRRHRDNTRPDCHFLCWRQIVTNPFAALALLSGMVTIRG